MDLRVLQGLKNSVWIVGKCLCSCGANGLRGAESWQNLPISFRLYVCSRFFLQVLSGVKKGIIDKKRICWGVKAIWRVLLKILPLHKSKAKPKKSKEHMIKNKKNLYLRVFPLFFSVLTPARLLLKLLVKTASCGHWQATGPFSENSYGQSYTQI